MNRLTERTRLDRVRLSSLKQKPLAGARVQAAFIAIFILVGLPAHALAQVLAAPPASAEAPGTAELEQTLATAEAFQDALDAGDYAKASAMMAPKMQAALPIEKLRAANEGLAAQLGDRVAREPARAATFQGTSVVVIPLNYPLAALHARLHFDDAGKIDGFFIAPASADTGTTAAPETPSGSSEKTDSPTPDQPKPSAGSAAESSARDADFAVGSIEPELPGTLLLPDSPARPPVVVFVHGSGPHDRDSTIGPNPVFRDLAEGLAAKGIASLRYDKRTLVDPQGFSGAFTVDRETVDDAVDAIRRLAADERIDHHRIYLIGHSLGALMAPRIASRAAGLRGAVLLATPGRQLDDMVVEQMQTLAEADGNIDANEAKGLEAVEKMRRELAEQLADQPDETAMMLGLPAAYWRDLKAYDPIATARNLDIPMLVVQGGRDYQVTETDFQIWLKAFENVPRVRFAKFDKLDHLLASGEGPSSPADYAKREPVEPDLIREIAAWIKTDGE